MTTTPPVHPFAYVIFPDSNGYRSQKYDGTITPPAANPPDPDPSNVIQQALNDVVPAGTEIGPGGIYITAGNYNFDSGFQGLNLNASTRLTLDPKAHFKLPSGYASYVFKLECNNTTEIYDCIIDGGIISEVDPPQRNWTGLLLIASTNNPPDGKLRGVLFNKFMNVTLHDANIGINLRVEGNSGFINANTFEFLKMWTCNTFIEFDTLPVAQYVFGSQNQGIFQNHFNNLQCQTGNMIIFGIKDIQHIGNIFIDVNIWDLPSQAKYATIHQDAINTMIIGGIMTGLSNTQFNDDGYATKIFDANQGIKFGNDNFFTRTRPTIQIGETENRPDIGTTIDKMGFFGTTPVIQQDGGSAPDLTTIWNALKAYGLLR